jgi:hypothetical protein
MTLDALSPTFCAWAAGFFDGEGTVYISSRDNTKLSLLVSVGQVDPAPLEKLKEAFGGSIKLRRRPRGCTWIYVLTLSAKIAEGFLRAISPYAVVKAKEIAIALDFRGTFFAGTKKSHAISKFLQTQRLYYRAQLKGLKARKIQELSLSMPKLEYP